MDYSLKTKLLIALSIFLLIGGMIYYLLPPAESRRSVSEFKRQPVKEEQLTVKERDEKTEENPILVEDEMLVRTTSGNVKIKKRNSFDSIKKMQSSDKSVEMLHKLLENPTRNYGKILSLAHNMSQSGTLTERYEALDAFKKIGGKNAVREIIDHYINDGNGGGVINNTADNENDNNNGGNGGGGGSGSSVQDELKEEAIDTLKHIIEESLFSGEEVMDKSSWLSVLNDLDYMTCYSYMALLAQFGIDKSVPIFLDMYDSEDSELQYLSRSFVSMLANGHDMSDKDQVAEWLESRIEQEAEDNKVKAY